MVFNVRARRWGPVRVNRALDRAEKHVHTRNQSGDVIAFEEKRGRDPERARIREKDRTRSREGASNARGARQ